MGIFWAQPVQYQQPLVVTQPGLAGQTTVVYGAPIQPYGYGYNPGLGAVAEVALVADVVADVAIIDAIYGGKKNKTKKNVKKIDKKNLKK